jgi:hypothetical protein
MSLEYKMMVVACQGKYGRSVNGKCGRNRLLEDLIVCQKLCCLHITIGKLRIFQPRLLLKCCLQSK